MKIILLLFPLFLISSVIAQAQGIKGFITDSGGQPVAFANIYVPALKTGTTSNSEGQFQLKLPGGEWEVLFQYLGYKTFSNKYQIGDSFTEVKVVMYPQSISLKEIKFLSSGEDPAYYIMRRAIALAPYYQNQVSEYDCKLYLKGSGVVNKIPKLFKKRMEKGGVEKDKLNILESLNKIHFELPDKLEQEVLAMRSSGNDKNSNPMQMVTTNLYNVSEYGVASPVSRNAMKVYNFKLEGVFEDQGKLINKIRVLPKVKGQGMFDGYINIVEGYWNIHSADLDFSMPMMDVSMRQLYGLVDENTWMPTSFDFIIDIAVLGIGMKYSYVASFSDYSVKLNPKLDHSYLKTTAEKEAKEAALVDSLEKAKEMAPQKTISASKNQEKIDGLLQKESLTNREMYQLERLMDKEVERTLPPEPLEIVNPVKVSEGALKNDSSFWSDIRPVPLTAPEIVTFVRKDSLLKIQETPEYQDSLRDARQKFRFTDLIKGRTYRYEKDSARFSSRFTISGIIYSEGLSFNTVDGFRYALPFSYILSDTLGRRLSASANVAYSFSREQVDADALIYYMYDGINRSWVQVSGGVKADDFKRAFPLSRMANDFYTLFLEDNTVKFYKNKFASVLWGTEITNGFTFRAGFRYSGRSPLENHSSYKFIDLKNKHYTPNIPPIEGLTTGQVEASNSSAVQARLSYTPRQRYRIRNNIKNPVESKFPTFTLNYEKGIEKLLGSHTNYDFVEMSASQKLQIGFDNYFDYNLNAGGFLNHKKLFAQDFKYFNASNQAVSFSNTAGRFFLLGYYEPVMEGYFAEAHVSFDFEKFLLKRLPLLNRTIIRENLFGSFLNTKTRHGYFEAGYGLSDIFLMMDASVVAGFENGKYRSTGIRICINLN